MTRKCVQAGMRGVTDGRVHRARAIAGAIAHPRGHNGGGAGGTPAINGHQLTAPYAYMPPNASLFDSLAETPLSQICQCPVRGGAGDGKP